MIEFKSCLDDREVKDLCYHGPCFTWTNKQHDDPIAKKLDRVLANEHWLFEYPLCQVIFSGPAISYHSQGLVKLHCHTPVAGSKPFKFFNFWFLILIFNRQWLQGGRLLLQILGLFLP
ncbi:hypothetical protein N665_0618s0010 [Sinapis alba]|nr:hypothetical protein N665_0618s0010 [Sinapis alba]